MSSVTLSSGDSAGAKLFFRLNPSDMATGKKPFLKCPGTRQRGPEGIAGKARKGIWCLMLILMG